MNSARRSSTRATWFRCTRPLEPDSTATCNSDVLTHPMTITSSVSHVDRRAIPALESTAPAIQLGSATPPLRPPQGSSSCLAFMLLVVMLCLTHGFSARLLDPRRRRARREPAPSTSRGSPCARSTRWGCLLCEPADRSRPFEACRLSHADNCQYPAAPAPR